jgi:hypothetical protein
VGGVGGEGGEKEEEYADEDTEEISPVLCKWPVEEKGDEVSPC